MSVLPTNGRLTRIDVASAPTTTGSRTWVEGDAIDAPVTIDRPTHSQQVTLGALLSKVSQVIYVCKADLPEGTQLQKGFKVQANQTGEASQLFEVIERTFRVFGELTHFELFCQAA